MANERGRQHDRNDRLRLPEDALGEGAVVGISGSSSGGHWKPDDAPITLATWDHITRGAINAWWDNLPAEPASD